MVSSMSISKPRLGDTQNLAAVAESRMLVKVASMLTK